MCIHSLDRQIDITQLCRWTIVQLSNLRQERRNSILLPQAARSPPTPSGFSSSSGISSAWEPLWSDRPKNLFLVRWTGNNYQKLQPALFPLIITLSNILCARPTHHNVRLNGDYNERRVRACERKYWETRWNWNHNQNENHHPHFVICLEPIREQEF